MNRFIIITMLLSFIHLTGQEKICGFDAIQKEIESNFPQEKEKRLRIEKQLYYKNLYSKNARNPANNDNRIYEIPVVVHVIESKDPSNDNLKLTDIEIENWIEDTNKIYATTYGGDFYAKGDGAEGGTVFPFRLALAKRNPNCEATNGIIRYDFTKYEEYNKNGVKSSEDKGIEVNEVKKEAPHWPESSYFNLYIVLGFDGDKGSYGLHGWAGFPSWGDQIYESFMKVQVVKNKGNVTLAHEMGHAMGLYHPFHNSTNPNQGEQCPEDTGDCLIDNDQVCDTQPTKYFLSVAPPTNNDINECVNANFDGVQYNIMNYTSAPKKFTPGQRQRALDLFLSQRKSLTESTVAQPINNNVADNSVQLTPATCSPSTRINNNPYVFIGASQVQLGSINNITGVNSSIVYTDNSVHTCARKSLFTDLPENKTSKLTIKGGDTNSHYYNVWIDLNNDGTFEDDELIKEKRLSSGDDIFEVDITPEKIKNAVKNTYLRMRVRADLNPYDVCADLEYGEIEDYAVRIVTEEFLNKSIGKVGINTDQPEATLDVREKTVNDQPQGVKFPSFTTDEREKFDKLKIKEGTMIYNKTLKCLEIFTNNQWKCIPFRN